MAERLRKVGGRLVILSLWGSTRPRSGISSMLSFLTDPDVNIRTIVLGGHTEILPNDEIVFNNYDISSVQITGLRVFIIPESGTALLLGLGLRLLARRKGRRRNAVVAEPASGLLSGKAKARSTRRVGRFRSSCRPGRVAWRSSRLRRSVAAQGPRHRPLRGCERARRDNRRPES